MAEDGEPVKLHVYDLSQGMAKQMSMSLLGKVIEGIWHTGVVVFGREYWFGGGIQSAPVHAVPYGRPVQAIPMGSTQVPKELFEEFLADIGPRYTMETYSLLTHNCNNFSDEVCQFLTGQSVPSHIVGLPSEVINSPFGALILPMVERLETTLRYGGVPQPPHPAMMGSGGGSGDFPDFRTIAAPPQPTATATNTTNTVPAVTPPSIAVGTTSNARSASAAAAAPGSAAEPPLPATAGESKTPRERAAAAAEARAAATAGGDKTAPMPAADVPPAVVPAEAKSLQGAMSGAAAGESVMRESKAKVHEEITKEFTLIMAGGGLNASEAATEAMRRVMQRHGLAVATASTSTSTAGA